VPSYRGPPIINLIPADGGETDETPSAGFCKGGIRDALKGWWSGTRRFREEAAEDIESERRASSEEASGYLDEKAAPIEALELARAT
jgi:hypothetical protein